MATLYIFRGFQQHVWRFPIYSDQRDQLHDQKLAHQELTDIKSWGSVIDDLAYLNYTARPGMIVLSYIPPMQKYILIYKFPGDTQLDRG